MKKRVSIAVLTLLLLIAGYLSSGDPLATAGLPREESREPPQPEKPQVQLTVEEREEPEAQEEPVADNGLVEEGILTTELDGWLIRWEGMEILCTEEDGGSMVFLLTDLFLSTWYEDYLEEIHPDSRTLFTYDGNAYLAFDATGDGVASAEDRKVFLVELGEDTDTGEIEITSQNIWYFSQLHDLVAQGNFLYLMMDEARELYTASPFSRPSIRVVERSTLRELHSIPISSLPSRPWQMRFTKVGEDWFDIWYSFQEETLVNRLRVESPPMFLHEYDGMEEVLILPMSQFGEGYLLKNGERSLGWNRHRMLLLEDDVATELFPIQYIKDNMGPERLETYPGFTIYWEYIYAYQLPDKVCFVFRAEGAHGLPATFLVGIDLEAGEPYGSLDFVGCDLVDVQAHNGKLYVMGLTGGIAGPPLSKTTLLIVDVSTMTQLYYEELEGYPSRMDILSDNVVELHYDYVWEDVEPHSEVLTIG